MIKDETLEELKARTAAEHGLTLAEFDAALNVREALRTYDNRGSDRAYRRAYLRRDVFGVGLG